MNLVEFQNENKFTEDTGITEALACIKQIEPIMKAEVLPALDVVEEDILSHFNKYSKIKIKGASIQSIVLSTLMIDVLPMYFPEDNLLAEVAERHNIDAENLQNLVVVYFMFKSLEVAAPSILKEMIQ